MATLAAVPTVIAVDVPEGGEGRAVSVEWSTGERASFNVLWLRDNCPTGGDKRSAFRTFSVAELDPDLTIVQARSADGGLSLTFSDGHDSTFDLTWLHEHRSGVRHLARARTWRSDMEPAVIDFSSVGDRRIWFQLLEAVATDGVALVSGVQGEGTGELASRLGHVRETDFGRFFDIISEPEVWTMSQSTAAMDPHTDDPYRYTPSGFSILHCIEASATGGGRSTLVDGFAVAEAIRSEAPEAFELLSTVSVPWIRRRSESVDQGEAVHMVAHAPVIAVDGDGDVCGIRFHERSMDTIDLAAELIDDFYRALIEFTIRIRSSEFQWEHGLLPGEAIAFDNQRVLHGRSEFDGDPGRRHLRLCTVDRDQVHSALRLLRVEFAPGTEEEKLTAGNLS